MKKNSLASLLMLFIILFAQVPQNALARSPFQDIPTATETPTETPRDSSHLQLFIQGKWVGEFSKETGVQYQLQFLPFGILLVNIKNFDDKYEARFSYELLSEDRILIKGRFIDEILITGLNREQMIIYSIHGFIPNGVYMKAPFINTQLIGTSIIVLVLFLIVLMKKGRKNQIL